MNDVNITVQADFGGTIKTVRIFGGIGQRGEHYTVMMDGADEGGWELLEVFGWRRKMYGRSLLSIDDFDAILDMIQEAKNSSKSKAKKR